MKIATIRTKIKLGVFVICVAAVAALALLLAGDNVTLFKKSREYKAHFTNTGGLIEGAPVRIGGVEVGHVSKIVIASPNGDLAIVATLKINSPYDDLINSSASVALETQGLLGDKFVSLYPGSGLSKEPLEEGAIIATREAEGLNKMVEKSSDIMDQVSNTTKKIDDFAAGLPDAKMVTSASNDFAASTRALRELMTRMAAEDSAIAMLNDPESKRMLRNSLQNMESATAHLDSVAKKIDGGQGTLGALVNDRSMYEDMRSILGKIDRGKIARRVFIEAAEQDSKDAPR
ncbi:MAG TPA: MlaD family protein [Oligoflexus sp.]|uniref:MlaD family protein n=1 Tax=Oligoflexus sp. TaxID=1971216 RepID=UPI002D5C499D|nr:MlaD family protein [Oligoflexus sp.]HYX33777.1 MlaD family protein [Oligoflexus sp.]